jgi:hypothetical protein
LGRPVEPEVKTTVNKSSDLSLRRGIGCAWVVGEAAKTSPREKMLSVDGREEGSECVSLDGGSSNVAEGLGGVRMSVVRDGHCLNGEAQSEAEESESKKCLMWPKNDVWGNLKNFVGSCEWVFGQQARKKARDCWPSFETLFRETTVLKAFFSILEKIPQLGLKIRIKKDWHHNFPLKENNETWRL